ncbi:heat shock protein 70 [Thalassoporum mexicanum PCC 7367]|uniref:Hsp70 family protein n=1 Tax=Thalassoporum mexicanum TaxID=3457544 RepID=UPI00029FF7FB|nr:Hsp70 family protein [Pseudanabaena sp. PCC 7367]AFY70578.1 heat shock protein 70 [Pseudanabaena sp. PCC 7367]
MVAIAVDFGNSNTVAAKWHAVTDRPETLKLPSISRPAPHDFLVPSLLYLQDIRGGKSLIGQEVLNAGVHIDQSRCFDQIKRSLSASIGFVPKIDGIRAKPELIGKLFLNKLFAALRSQQIDPTELIFTAPVQAYEHYLRWLGTTHSQLVPHAPAIRVRIIDEPTAAALGYEVAQPGALVLVIDFGGGTLDLSLIRMPHSKDASAWGDFIGDVGEHEPESRVEVIAKTGQILGGTDVDRFLMEDFAEQQDWLQIPAPGILQGLMEQIKIELSDQETASRVFFEPEQMNSFEINYDRAQFEQVLRQRGFYRVLQLAIDEIINRAMAKGVLKMDLKQVLLVGGSTLIPSVREFVANYLCGAQIHSGKPFAAVAYGALMLQRGTQVKDHLFHSYAIRYWQGETQQWCYHPLFRRGQTYPTKRPVELLLRASQTDQEKIELVIGELEIRAAGSTEVIFQGDRLVTTTTDAIQQKFLPLGGSDAAQAIATLDPLGQPGSDRLKAQFQVNERRQLTVTVIDLLTDRQIMLGQPVADLR